MDKLQVFENEEFGKIRTVKINGEPWLVGKDVAEALGYVNTKDALSNHVDEEDKQIIQRSQFTTFENEMLQEVFPINFVPADIPNRGLTVINESGLYSLVLSSKLPGAKRFKRWITSEVLPAIRKTGSYSTGRMEEEKIRAQSKRSEAMLLNAKTRAYRTIMDSVKDKGLSAIAMEVFGLTALETVGGKKIDYRPPVEKTYTAGELAREFGVSANLIGRIANANGLKNEAYGITVMDKSPHSAKEIPSFRYNEAGRKRLEDLIKNS